MEQSPASPQGCLLKLLRLGSITSFFESDDCHHSHQGHGCVQVHIIEGGDRSISSYWCGERPGRLFGQMIVLSSLEALSLVKHSTHSESSVLTL